MDRFDRIYALHKQLANARVPVSCRRLTETLECSRATVIRIIRDMRLHLGAPIEYSREHNGYCMSRSPDGRAYELPGLWFTAAELHALLTCQQLLHSIEPGLFDSLLAPLKERIEKLLKTPRFIRRQLGRRVRVVTAARRMPPAEVFSPLASALLERRRLRFRYHSRSTDEESRRTVSPQRLVHYRDNWYLDAWDHDRDALRIFSVDRIHAPERLDEHAMDIDENELDELLSSGYGIFAGRPRASAVLRFSARAARWVADEKWHSKQRGTWLPDGRFQLEIPYSDGRELMMDILRYGGDVEVVGPPDLRRDVHARLAAAARQYD